jgi:hypothetical protein
MRLDVVLIIVLAAIGGFAIYYDHKQHKRAQENAARAATDAAREKERQAAAEAARIAAIGRFYDGIEAVLAGLYLSATPGGNDEYLYSEGYGAGLKKSRTPFNRGEAMQFIKSGNWRVDDHDSTRSKLKLQSERNNPRYDPLIVLDIIRTAQDTYYGIHTTYPGGSESDLGSWIKDQNK